MSAFAYKLVVASNVKLWSWILRLAWLVDYANKYLVGCGSERLVAHKTSAMTGNEQIPQR